MTGTDTYSDEETTLNLVAPVLAWIFPGWGHWHLRHRTRALLIGAGILFLYIGGLFIGGIDVIDREEDFWWYCGQVCAGPATLAVEWVKDERLNPPAQPGVVGSARKPQPPLPPDDPAYAPDYVPAYSVSLGHANEMGTLFTTIAGMLNLIVILECVRLPRAARSTTPAPLGGAS